MIDKKARIDYLAFSVEIIGAIIVSIGILTIPLRIFGNELIVGLIIAIGTIIMIIGRFFR